MQFFLFSQAHSQSVVTDICHALALLTQLKRKETNVPLFSHANRLPLTWLLALVSRIRRVSRRDRVRSLDLVVTAPVSAARLPVCAPTLPPPDPLARFLELAISAP